MSEEPNDVSSFVVSLEQTEQTSVIALSPHEGSKENKTSDAKTSSESTASKEKSPKKETKIIKQKSGEAEKTPEGGKSAQESIAESIEVRGETQEIIEADENKDNFTDVIEISDQEENEIRETHESLEEVEKKAKDYFATAAEHILSSPSDLSEVVSSFENLQPIYGNETLNFRSNNENISTPKDEKDKIDDENIRKKSDIDTKVKKSPKGEKSNAKSDKSDKKDADWEMKRDRRKSSVLTDADLTRKSSEDPYPIGIPLRKKVNKSTRKKLWREIQRRKPFISANVYAHIQHFAKPPFQTWGCHNCNYKKDVKSYAYAFFNE